MSTKNDQDKNRLELVPPSTILALGEVLTFGAKKYEPWGWRKVDQANQRYYAAALRHLLAWRTGETLDPESGLTHLAHALCNISFLYELNIDEEVHERIFKAPE